MARFVKGDIIVVPFPFSDLTQTKRRPALVISALEGNDLSLCQITSQSVRDNYAILLDDKDFNTGSLKQSSYIRPNRIFTADNHIVLYRVGDLKLDKINEIIEKVIEIIRK